MGTKEIGKIQLVRYGIGGYQDAQFGVTFTLGGKSWGVGDFWGGWTRRSEGAKYTHSEWLESHAKTVERIVALMSDAGCAEIHDLEGKPVEAVFQDGRLISWRILTEVL